MQILEVKSDFTITELTPMIACNSGTALAVTLKSATGAGDLIYIKNIGSADVTVTANLPDLIDGAATKVLTQYESCIVLDYKTNVWIVI